MQIQWLHDATLRLGLIGAVVLTLASCGAVTGSGTPAVGGDLLVLPAVADLFPDVPTQFSITGGKPGYSVFSSNNIVLPLESAVVGTTFFAIPKSVSSDTPVTITVRDADGKTKGVIVTVKPAVINNNVIFTIVNPAGSGCGANALCSGGTAQVLVTASLNGTVLVNRPIRFAVFQGDFLFVTPGTGTLVNSITINTDERGEAVVRLTATVGAPPQVATLTSTDVTSGLVRRFNFNIVPPTLSALPSANVTFEGAKGATGSTEGFCPVGGRVDFYVFGGVPPYTVASLLPDLVFVSPNLVLSSGGRTTATLNGCGQTPLVVTDSTLKAIETALIIGVKGPAGNALPPPTPTPPFVVSPTSLSLTCGGSGNVSAVGGTGGVSTTIVTGGVSSPSFTAQSSGLSPATISFTRAAGAATAPSTVPSSPIVVNVSNGSAVIPVSVSVPLNCPQIVFSPASVTLSAGSPTATSTISGGTAPYTATSSDTTRVTVVPVVGTTLTISRPVTATAGSATVTVTDNVGNFATISATIL